MLEERRDAARGVLGPGHRDEGLLFERQARRPAWPRARRRPRPWPGRGPRRRRAASSAAQASAASSTSSGATTRLTSPIASASSARTWRPVKMSSLARDDPIRRGRRWVPPPPGMTPSRTSGSPKRASSAQTRKSQASASSSPPPRAYPLTAAMVARGTDASAPSSGGEAGAHGRRLRCRRARRCRRRRRRSAGRPRAPPPPAGRRGASAATACSCAEHGAGEGVGLRAVQPDERDAVGSPLHRDEGLSHGRTVPEPRPRRLIRPAARRPPGRDRARRPPGPSRRVVNSSPATSSSTLASVRASSTRRSSWATRSGAARRQLARARPGGRGGGPRRAHRSPTPRRPWPSSRRSGAARRPGRARSSICSRSRRASRTPGRSALLITKTSATSSRPALLACMESPQPGVTTTTVVSAAEAISTSICPTPTVSTITTAHPGRAEQADGVGDGQGQPAQVPPGGHGADEHGRVERVLAACAPGRPGWRRR